MDVAGRPRDLGRYVLLDEIGTGGMATVHLGWQVGDAGFSRIVAIKRLREPHVRDARFRMLFAKEARVASTIRHPNVVPTLDVVERDDELFLVMDLVEGASLFQWIRAARKAGVSLPPPIVAAIMADALRGLHAAHSAVDRNGDLLGIVHRDVSPQNVVIGTDGVARIIDFGVAKAKEQTLLTEPGKLRGKLAYMAPEQVRGAASAQTDVYSASVVMWEALTSRRLFHAASEEGILANVLHAEVAAPSSLAPGIDPELDAVVLRGLARDPERRFGSAREMALALERHAAPASEVAGWQAHHLAEEVARIGRLVSSAAPPSVVEGLAEHRAASHVERRRMRRAFALAVVPLLVFGTAVVLHARAVPVARSNVNPSPAITEDAPTAAPPTEAPSSRADEAPTPPVRVVAQGRRPRLGSPPRPPAKDGRCDPPYSIDASGKKRFRPECL